MVLYTDYSHQPLETPFQHAKSYRPLRSRRKRSHEHSVENFEQATRLLQLFHAHGSHSLYSIVEHPEDDLNCSYEKPTFFSMSHRLPKAKTMSCLSDLARTTDPLTSWEDDDGHHETTSDPSRMERRPIMSIPEYSEHRDDEDEDDDWEF